MSGDSEYAYIEVTDRFEVPVGSRLAASAARRLACRLLGLDPLPELRWFRPARTERERLTAHLADLRREAVKLAYSVGADPDGWRQATAHRRAHGIVSRKQVLGLAYYHEGDAVWVRADLGPEDTAWTVLHECYHRHQRAAGRWASKSQPDAEQARLIMELEASSFADLHAQEALAEASSAV